MQMRIENLKIQLEDYLEKNNITYYKNSLNYLGLREDVPHPDGNKGSYHTFRFQTSVFEGEFSDSDATYYAYFPIDTNSIAYIIGPQTFRVISDESNKS